MTRIPGTSRKSIVALLAFASSVALPAGTAGAESQAHFRSPSGNINCRMLAGPYAEADCWVFETAWAHPAPDPVDCRNDWFPTELRVDHRDVTVGSCRGDVGPACNSSPACTTLGYGDAILLDHIMCYSAIDGITCRNQDGNGHGFRVSRESYDLY